MKTSETAKKIEELLVQLDAKSFAEAQIIKAEREYPFKALSFILRIHKLVGLFGTALVCKLDLLDGKVRWVTVSYKGDSIASFRVPLTRPQLEEPDVDPSMPDDKILEIISQGLAEYLNS